VSAKRFKVGIIHDGERSDLLAGNTPDNKTALRIAEELRVAGCDAEFLAAHHLSSEVVHGKTSIHHQGDTIAIDGAYLAANFFVPYNDMNKTMEAAGIRFFNPVNAVEISQNKYATHQALRDVPMPRTALVFNYAAAKAKADEWGYPIAFKTLRGDSGDGVDFADYQHQAPYVLQRLARDGQGVLVQDCLDFGNKHKRILIAWGEVPGRYNSPVSNGGRTWQKAEWSAQRR
jgi:glutathione synthase/RimK-type ligase-like ATP-grasp enzyme